MSRRDRDTRFFGTAMIFLSLPLKAAACNLTNWLESPLNKQNQRLSQA
ncbi:MAG TPA: hypothetical protein VGB82_01095 [Alphaproteobacteria bacterium]|jgi:hypothetical protein